VKPKHADLLLAGAALLAFAGMAPSASAADWPSGYAKCADEWGTCVVGSAKRKVSYGIADTWVVKEVSGDVACRNTVFTDPFVGRPKVCAIGPLVTAPAPEACKPLAQRVRTAHVSVSTGRVAPSDEYTPTVIAPRSDGSSVLAWTNPAANRIRAIRLNAADAWSANLPDIDGLEVHDAIATPQGLALAVVANDPDIHSPKYCRSSATPDKAVCGKMDLVRTDANGKLLTRTTLTKKRNVDSVDAQFIWWYGHTARLATDGSRIGAYYRSAMSTPRPGAAGEVDIHAGDTLQFVDATSGALLAGGWNWGCSHSWSVRLGHGRAGWAATCHGDGYPNAMQVARLATPTAAPTRLQWLGGSDPARRALGGMVRAADGFWINYIADENGRLTLKLAKLPDQGAALAQTRTITVATALDADYPFRPTMAAYGKGKLLMGWKANGRLSLAVADAATGALLEGPVATNLDIDRFQEMVSAPNGDVLWAHSSAANAIEVNRVAACPGG
jgi:hypothetical protein